MFLRMRLVLVGTVALSASAWLPSSSRTTLPLRAPTTRTSTMLWDNESSSTTTTPTTTTVTDAMNGEATAPKTTTTTAATTTVYQPILDFGKHPDDAIARIDRLDDAIMGGISTSSVRKGSQESVDDTSSAPYFATWSGVCRTDGGGFCGFRTLPFREPLATGGADGIYATCRLTSDDEAHRRVWKMTTRSRPDRGELLYQALFDFGGNGNDAKSASEWTVVKVPFESFQLVKGPRMIEGGAPLNTTGGLYQIGMTMSKFAFGFNTTELPNFRDGYFEMQFQEIGLYKEPEENVSMDYVAPPAVYSKEETKKRRSPIVKVLFPLVKVFFSEQSQRRKSAMRILREERKLSRGKAILWGLKNRAKGYGMARSLAKTTSILAIDAFRATLLSVLRVSLLYPLRLVRKIVATMTGKKLLAVE